MAHIQRRQQRRGDGTVGPPAWRARYRGPDGKERSKTFSRKTEASRWVAVQKARMADGNWMDPRAGQVKLGIYCDQFVAGKVNLKPKTRASYESLVRTCIKPTLGDFNLSAVKPYMVDEWLTGLQLSGLSASRVRQAYNLLGVVFKKAARKGLCFPSPCQVEEDELPRLNRALPRYLTANEVLSLSEVMAQPYDLFVLLLAYTGMRFGEAAALRRNRCDILHRRLLIAESLAEVNGRLFFGDTKNHQYRKIMFPEFLRSRLDDHLAINVGQESGALVFTGPDGGPLRYSNFRSRHWLPAVQRARPRSSQHPRAATHVRVPGFEGGASVKLVQTQLGHSDPALTLRLYQHLFPDDLDALAMRMDEVFRTGLTEAGEEISRPDRGLTLVPEDGLNEETPVNWEKDAPPAGLEPTTHGLGNRRSIL